MQYSRSESGLILAREEMGGPALERALKQIDLDLALQAWPRPDGPPLWKVVRYAGPDRPPETIASWVDERGEPLPLTEGLLDVVRRLDRNSRGEYVDPEEKNRRFRELVERDWERDTEAARDDWNFKHGRPVLPRSQSLRMSRDKQRAKGKKV